MKSARYVLAFLAAAVLAVFAAEPLILNPHGHTDVRLDDAGATKWRYTTNATFDRSAVAFQKFAAPTAKTTTATLTGAEVASGFITANQGAAGAATYTFPTGTLLAAALPASITTGDCFYFQAVNISTVAAEDVTFQGDTGTTLVGNATMASNAAVTDQAWATFLIRCTGYRTFSIYRVG